MMIRSILLLFCCWLSLAWAEAPPSNTEQSSEALIQPIKLPPINLSDQLNSPDPEKVMKEVPNLPSLDTEDRLVDYVWVSERIRHPNMRIIDARAPERYATGHILGAANVPADITISADGGLAPINKIATLLSNAGVNENTLVVIYGDVDYVNASRLYWVLRTLGHDKVVILDGGFAYWLRKRRPWTKDLTVIQPRIFKLVPTDQWKISAQKLRSNRWLQVVDARDQKRYLGVDSAYAYNGYIRRAFSIPAQKNRRYQRGSLKIRPRVELSGVYGVLKPKIPVVVYDDDAKQSALAFFNLERLGYRVRVLEGGVAAWKKAGGTLTVPQIRLKNNTGL